MRDARQRPARLLAILGVALAALALAPEAQAYVGPGAGFAFVSSFFAVLVTFVLAFFKLFTWPLRFAVRVFRSRKALAKSRVRRVVVVGLDGQDPELTDRFMAQGLLPNFARLKELGCYRRLDTSLPAESPVAWSCFQTGANPGRHKVFDFMVPNRKSYLPELSSARVLASPRTLKLGKLRLPLGRPAIDLGRKSVPFWKVLGDHGIFSTILRVPITFPPEKFRGVLLSAMSVPDLKGTQGTFSYFSSEPGEADPYAGGVRIAVEAQDGVVRGWLGGPDNTLVEGAGELRIPFEVRLGRNGEAARLHVGKRSYPLPLGAYTPWIELEFRPALRFKVRGIARFYLKETAPHFKLYVTPIQIDPDRPALPISHPFSYAIYLSKTQGRYATLGLAEDTWALNERVLDEQAFLEQAWLIHDERERMLFDALEKTQRGCVVCVFDITDRLQHMFFRYLERDHPANRGKDTERHAKAIEELYVRMDRLVGRVLDSLGKKTTLIVMSDHGFKPFRRGVNLNAWLLANGYLALEDGTTAGRWYQGVDWSRTRAFALGLGGIYLNVRGREARGIVEPGDEQKRLKQELRGALRALTDTERGGASAIAEVWDTAEAYRGPYVREAPDLFVGFRVGYRVSWDCAVGLAAGNVFEDNVKSWSGDHCMNPPDVPGIFFSNRAVSAERVNIMDIGPTVLDLFGVATPAWCDGRSVMPAPASEERK